MPDFFVLIAFKKGNKKRAEEKFFDNKDLEHENTSLAIQFLKKLYSAKLRVLK